MRSRGLPDDHAGPIRIIDIEGVDANMCCGTHVSNLSHLQVEQQTNMHGHTETQTYIIDIVCILFSFFHLLYQFQTIPFR